MSNFKTLVLADDVRINGEWYECPRRLYDAIDNLLADRDETTRRSRATIEPWSLEAEWSEELIAIMYGGKRVGTITLEALDELCEHLEEALDAEDDSLHGGYSETDG